MNTKQNVYYLAQNIDLIKSKTHIKQYHTVIYLSYSLDESLSGESMALKFTSRFNSTLRVLCKKKQVFVSPFLQTAL